MQRCRKEQKRHGGPMSDEKKLEIAKEYVDQQLKTMREFGAAPKDMSEDEYKSLVEEVAETVRT
jgi:ATP-dependent RNA circularization protein (DNA/RNA ligase family)